MFALMDGKTSAHSLLAEYSAEERSRRLLCRLRLFSTPRRRASSRESVTWGALACCAWENAPMHSINMKKTKARRNHPPSSN